MDTQDYQYTVTLPTNAKEFKRRASNQYNGELSKPLVRELIQNSVDAGARNIYIKTGIDDNGNHFISAEDDGHGISWERFKTAFLTIGGSEKRTNRPIGSFGAAKELISFSWEWWEIASSDFVVKGSGGNYASPLPNDRNGFKVTCADTDRCLRKSVVDSFVLDLVNFCNIPCKVYLNDELVPQGRKLTKKQIVAEFDFGILYAVKPNNARNESEGNVYVRTSGLLTTNFYRSYLTKCMYLELTKPATELLTENRDGLRYEYSCKIDDVINDMVADAVRHEKTVDMSTESVVIYDPNWSHDIFGEVVSNSLNLYSRSGLYKKMQIPFTVSDEAIYTEPIAIRGLPKNKKNPEECRELLLDQNGKLLPEFSKLLDKVRKVQKMTGESDGIRLGLWFGSRKDKMKIEGCLTNISGFTFLFINPVNTDLDNPLQIMDTVTHEMAHLSWSGHSQDFDNEKYRILKRVWGKDWRKAIRQVELA